MGDKTTKILIIVLIILILVAGGIMAYKITKDKQDETIEVSENQNEEILTANVQEEKEKEIQIFKGNDRPIAVMIDNHNQAWPQAGLNQAYLVYEIIVEGGETRLMALFKGTTVDKIGPVRSSRHYFLDYAMENDAIYAHFGWSPQAQSDISKYKINNINGITESESTFWRVKDKYSPHNAVTSTEALLKVAESKGYKTTSSKESVLNYVTDDVKLEDGQSATSITIPHSTLQTVKYEYDEQNQVYKRYARKKAQTDWETGDSITTKNIIITFCDNYTLNDSENKGRQGLKNIGTFNGYYITNGKAIKIKCIKEARNLQTRYEDLEGNEIDVNDGNTWINICPNNAEVEIEGTDEVENTENNTTNNM
ncbi:MAG: DUF3048 domain-containing protein [Clostridia bacterium]|nr:DUF3048 domain-containing protein [Clostridia bacterium]